MSEIACTCGECGHEFDAEPEGGHRLLCGDATRRENLDALMGGVLVDAVFTDPPYSSGGQFRADRAKSTVSKYVQTTQKAKRDDFSHDNKDQRAFARWASQWLGDAMGVAKPGAVVMVFSDWRQVPTVVDCIQAAGWIYRNLVTWWKPGCRMQRGRFSLSSEFIVYGSNGKPLEGEKSPQNVLQHATAPSAGKKHIAEKPVAMCAEALSVTVASAAILDPFAGSGTTIIAAEQLGRRCFAIEISETYCDVAVSRWEKFTGRKATKEKR